MQRAYHFETRFEAGGFSEGITWMVQRLILLNVFVFAAQLLLHLPFGGSPTAPGAIYAPPGGVIVTNWLAFHFTGPFQGFIWQPLTYMFLHGGLLHLFLNMLWLYVFGPDVERVLGTRQFLWFYLICGGLGVFATGIPHLMHGGSASVVGASGATLGVLIAYAYLYPTRQLFLFPLPVPINARAIVLFVVILNLVSALGHGPISVATHFGGMGVGLAYMALVPRIRRLSLRRGSATEHDKVGDAVDNIFRFDDKRRRM
ncbi:MAG: rhomboid family intramembrane serine protease [Candidatus Hydrogenedentota bacterium]